MKTEENSEFHKMPSLIRVTDIFIIIVILICAVLFIPLLRSNPRDTAVVYRVDDIIAEYPLDEDRIFYVEGVLGSLEVEIKDKRVRVNSSGCPRQICVNTGWISESYEQIICAPNRIFIGIESDTEKAKIDAVTQ